MTDLDSLLTGEDPVERTPVERNFGLNELYISKYAYQKAFRYASLMVKGRFGSLEVGGFLTKPKGSPDRIARDAFLTRGQEVSSTSYRLTAEQVAEAGKELEKEGQQIVGWWHSHGRMETFHSETDNINQMVLLNQISPSNYIIKPKERVYSGLQSRVEGNNLIFWDPENPSTTFTLELKDENPEVVAQRLKVHEEKRVGFSYSLVVNHHRWLSKRVPYCEIATRDLCTSCVGSKDVSIRTGYTLFDDGDYTIDDEQLASEILERVHILGTPRKTSEKNTPLLPEVFEQMRTAGTLTAPKFSPDLFSGKAFYRSRERYGKKEEKKDASKPIIPESEDHDR